MPEATREKQGVGGERYQQGCEQVICLQGWGDKCGQRHLGPDEGNTTPADSRTVPFQRP